MRPSSSTYACGQKKRKRSVFQERTVGNKVAKASSRREPTLQREAVTNTVALSPLARSAADRADIAFCSSPAAANSDESRERWARDNSCRLQGNDGPLAANANAPDPVVEAGVQDRLNATTAAADAASTWGNGGGRGRGRGALVVGERGAGRGGGRYAAEFARGGRGGHIRQRGCGREARPGRGGRNRRRASSNDEEKGTVSESDDDSADATDSADALPPPRQESTCTGSRTKSLPPSPTVPAPGASIEAPRVAAALFFVQALSSGDSNDDGDATQDDAFKKNKHHSGDLAVGQDARRVSDSAKVSAACPPLTPRRRLSLTRGRAAQETKRRRFQETAGAAGFDMDSHILDTMDWDD